jgi:16S rRNA (cytidine1402-2'-O)-methyltransferase
MKGEFFLVGVPIGNIDDFSFRAIKTLQSCNYIVCEDTRETKFILSHFDIKATLIPYTPRNPNTLEGVLNLLSSGKNLAFVCDRGMPCISDPGSSLVRDLKSKGVRIHCIPGPSSVTTAFSLSGYSGGFIFHGFLPRKTSEIIEICKNLCDLDYNIVFFEAAVRLNKTLETFSDIFGDRNITIARELTKPFEEIIQGSAIELKNIQFKGECVVIIKKI